jgi:hypothetical protein
MAKLIFSSIMTICVGLALFKPIFKDLGGFTDAIKYLLQPEIISLLKGEWDDDQWQSLKLGGFICLLIIAFMSSYSFYESHF